MEVFTKTIFGKSSMIGDLLGSVCLSDDLKNVFKTWDVVY